MHSIHHTEAFVVKSEPHGEANRRLWLFTDAFGLVVATVQGVRKPGAKLAMHTSDYSFISADLVKGKEVWWLTSASGITNPFIGRGTDERGRAFVRMLSVVDRFCQGEEAHSELFAHLCEGLHTLTAEELNARSFDTLCVWKAMVLLGYGTVSESQRRLFELPLLEAALRLDERERKVLIQETTAVIKESQL